jgi:2,3-bisphosphoglycerate-dependent phosphoglycerate mutase
MPQLILLRHGQSQWNLENRFTGWVDVDLSDTGREEARSAGERLKGAAIDRVFTSVLQRAEKTAAIALQAAGITGVPVERDAALNERHYGELQGLDKAETAKKYGDEQVRLWRRSYDVQPPGGESLKDTVARVMPYWRTKILPVLQQGQSVLVVAHGNSLRALTKELEALSDEQILKVEIATGLPIVYELDASGAVLSKREL